MKLKIVTMLFFAAFFYREGCGASTLSSISRIQNSGSVQFLMFFDEVPFYDAQLSGKRLDLTMPDTAVGPDVVTPEPDDILVRTKLTENQDTTLLNIFLRYSPQNLKVDPGPANSIVVTLVPGNRFTKTYQELMTGLGPIKSLKQEPRTTVGPLTFSPYAADWLSFLKHYHGYSFIELSPHLYFPPFPLTAILSWEHKFSYQNLLSNSDEFNGTDWFDALADIQKRLKTISSEQERQYLALTYADLLYRLGNSSAAHEQFGLLKKKYVGTDIGRLAHFAQILIEGQDEHFYKSQILLQRALKQEHRDSLLAPYIQLALAECFLATRQYKKAQSHLEDQQSLPEQAALRRDIRRGDLFFANKRFEEAAAIMDRYPGLNPRTLQPYSLNNYCTLLYQQKRFEESGRCYQRLETSLHDPEKQAKATYLRALSRIQSADNPATDDLFIEILNRFPGTQTALRAEIKRVDICYLEQSDCSAGVLERYRKITEKSTLRDVSLEAHFKAALVYHLSGDNRQAVAQLDILLRNHQSGRLRNEALALLIDTLPGVLSEMLEQNQYIDALSLAQQNRALFINDWIDHFFLFRLGLALEQLSLNHDALGLFLYLKRFPDFQLDEQLLAGLTRVSHAIADHSLVEDFSSTYLLHFPAGEHWQDVTFYLIDSTLSTGRIDRALKLLPEPLPESIDYRLLAASIHFLADNQTAAAQLLLPLARFSELPDNYRLILAESLFHVGRDEECVKLYKQLIEANAYEDLSQYRLAQIFTKNRNEDRRNEISTLFKAETDKSYWHRLFAQQQRFVQLGQPFSIVETGAD